MKLVMRILLATTLTWTACATPPRLESRAPAPAVQVPASPQPAQSGAPATCVDLAGPPALPNAPPATRCPIHALAGKAAQATERALARARQTRALRPADAAKLDDFEPPGELLRYRNPAPFVESAIARAYEPFPELAFEALYRAPPHEARDRLRRLFGVVARGPDGFERTSALAERHPVAFADVVALDREAGSCRVLAWLERSSLPRDDPDRLAALGALDTSDPLALHRWREALRDGPHPAREVAADGVARRRDRGAVPWLLPMLATNSGAHAARGALLAIAGSEETAQLFAQMSRECRPLYRLGAALALQFDDDARSAETLARLASDPDAEVRRQALTSIAALALHLDDPRAVFSASVETAVLRATSAEDAQTRWLAMNALWRLIVEKKRPLSAAMQSAAARTLAGPDGAARNVALVELADFFGADAELVLVVLAELDRVPKGFPHDDALAQARAGVGKPDPAAVRALSARSVPELATLLEAWLRR